MENKGLHVNMKKTKFMVLSVDLDVLQTKFMIVSVDLDALKKSGKYPCAVCYKGVGSNSIKSSQCKLWVHKKCTGITC